MQNLQSDNLINTEVGQSGRVHFKRRPGRLVLVVAALLAALITVLIIGSALGPVAIAPGHSLAIVLHRLGLNFDLTFSPTEQRIVEQLRLPRLLLAGIVGAGLATAGAVLQGLFRNPLADPGITGVSSGGSLGAVVALTTGLAGASLWALSIMAFIFALTTALLVYALSVSRGRIQMGALLLAGVALGSLMSAAISTLLTLTRDNELLREIIFWLLGGFINRGWDYVWIALPLVVIGMAICLFYTRELNLLLSGEDEAASLGVNVPGTRLVLLFATALITAGCVSVSGNISFVGLIVPHLIRLILGPSYRSLTFVSALAGAVFLMTTDTLARLVQQPIELPVGVITAFLGAPFFLILLYARKSRLQI